MEKIQWKVEGMTCANCALTVSKYLENQGQKNIKVNPINGDVSFEMIGGTPKATLIKGIKNLGYSVVNDEDAISDKKKTLLNNHFSRFLFCLPFTLILMLHMMDRYIHIHWLINPWIQLTLCIPVYWVGMSFFGKSAIKSIANKMPNMNVLVALGATAAFVYSLTGTIFDLGESYLFYETAATIITLVFLGNLLEDRSIESTQRALKDLTKSQKVMANMIAFDGDHKEVILPVENTQLRIGDLVLVREGEQVPIDCKILWGDAKVNEAIITGESLPLTKKAKDKLIGGSILVNGTVKAQVIATGEDTVLSGILNMVKQAQGEKPPIQKLADKISAVFVPIVIALALITLAANWIYLEDFKEALMRSIAVLVISCPCAMGLATPAAIAVGMGRAARSGILFRNATSLETFKDIRQVVFDKTGTLTTGKFTVSKLNIMDSEYSDEMFKELVASMEKYSSHPIAKSIAEEWKSTSNISWKKIEEIKGLGIKAEDQSNNVFVIGSFKIAQTLTDDDSHNVYVTKNEKLLGWIDIIDEIRPEAKEIVNYLHQKGMRTIILSGDRYAKTKAIGEILGIDEVIAEQTPDQKLEQIELLNKKAPTAMVGDGINDAPALAKATIGVSMSEASQIAMQSAQVVLVNHGIQNLPKALGLGKHTYLTIKQNLFWAFFYNIIAIPVASFGLLIPGIAALVMGLSDVVLAVNSVRLFVKKVV